MQGEIGSPAARTGDLPARWGSVPRYREGGVCCSRMIFESKCGAFAVLGVAIMIAIGESRLDLSQIVLPDRFAAQRTDRLPAGRSAIHQNKSHMASLSAVSVVRFANRRQDSPIGAVCIEGSLRDLLASKSNYSDCNGLLGGVKAQQPSAVALLAGLEAIDAPPRTEGSSPGVVPDETKLSVTDSAAMRRVLPTILKMVAHFTSCELREINPLADVDIRSA